MKLSQCLLLASALAIFAGAAIAQNPASTVTSTGQGFQVELIPPSVDPVDLCGPVLVDAIATLGSAPPVPVNFVYICDVSGSMENPFTNPFQDLNGDSVIDAGDDCNGDGVNGSALDALCFGLIALNQSIGNPGSVDVGLVAFGDGDKTADMSPIAGAQTFLSPPQTDVDANLVADVEDVVRSLDAMNGSPWIGGFGQFTPDITSGFGLRTRYNSGLNAANVAFATQAAGEINKAYFFSDGNPNPTSSFSVGAGTPLQAAIDAGTVINTFALGGFAMGKCGAGQPLALIADQTGGICTEVLDPSTLAAILPSIAMTQITDLVVDVNGIAVSATSGSETASMSLTGVDIQPELAIGANTVDATATAADGSIVTASIVVNATGTGGRTGPVINCPADIQICNDAGICGASVPFMVTGEDICGSSIAVVCDAVSGDFFPVGTSVVNCMVTDAAGRTDQCSFNITVDDCEGPVLDCQDIMAEFCGTGGGGGGSSSASSGSGGSGSGSAAASGSGSRGGHGGSASSGSGRSASGSGRSASGSGRSASGSASSGSASSGSASSGSASSGSASSGSASSGSGGSASASSGGSASGSASSGSGSGGSASGSASSGSGGSASGSASSGSGSGGGGTGATGAVVVFDINGEDACDGTLPATCDATSGSLFPAGVTTVNCTVTDTSGITSVCSFDIIVVDICGGGGGSGSGSGSSAASGSRGSGSGSSAASGSASGSASASGGSGSGSRGSGSGSSVASGSASGSGSGSASGGSGSGHGPTMGGRRGGHGGRRP